MAREVHVRILGSGGAVPSRFRWLSGVLIWDWMGNRILLDAGEGVQIRLQEAGHSSSSINVIAVTHAHGDHVNGLPGLLQSMYVNERTSPLHIVGPRSVIEFLEDVLEATESKLGFPVEKTIAEGRGNVTLNSSGGSSLTLSWFPTCHSQDSVGFRVKWVLRPRVRVEALEEKGLKPGPWVKRLLEEGSVEVDGVEVSIRDVTVEQPSASIVYTGDTAPCNSVLSAARGADVLIHDSTYTGEMGDEAVARGHSTAVDAAGIARAAGVRLLILTHISTRYRGGEALRILREARKIFPNSALAWDHARVILRI